jgi:hypothetical protein
MSKTKKTLSDLIPDSKNFNKGTAQGDILLTKSIEEFGFREAATLDVNGVLIGGNKRTAKAGQLGFEEVEIIKADSTKVYALQYDDIDITTEKGRRLALALNQTASKNILIDAEMVEAELSEAVCEEWVIDVGIKLTDEMGEDFSLPSGDKAPFQQMTFTLADEQATQIKNAIDEIKKTDEYKYAETMGNENSNGNALYLIIMQWAEQKK